MFYKDNDEIAVETILLEAVGEGFDGMVAVGEVIRSRSRLFKRDFGAVCLMPRQFSCWNDPAKAQRFLREHQKYRFMAYAAWMQSKKSRLTGGATDYHAECVRPYWAAAYRVSASIGRHLFYVREGRPDGL